MKYYLLGGTGNIGKSLTERYEASNISYEVVGRSHTMSSIITGDFDIAAFCDQDYTSDVLIYMLPGNRHQNVANIGFFCENVSLLKFKTIVFLSSISSFKSHHISSIDALDASNDPYGKRHCEIMLGNYVRETDVYILRLGLVTNSNTRWDEFLNKIVTNGLTFPPYQKNLPMVNVDEIFEIITNLPGEKVFSLPENAPSLGELGMQSSRFTLISIGKFLRFFSKNPKLGSLKLMKFLFARNKYE